MSSSELHGDVNSSLWILNFIDKVADDGQQRRTCLVGASHQQKYLPSFFSSVFLHVGALSLSWCVLATSRILNQKIYQPLRSFINPNIRKESEWEWKQINHAGRVRSETTHAFWSFPDVDLFCYYHLHLTQKKWEMMRGFTHVINNKKDGDNKPITKLHHWWFVIYFFFFRSTVQMTSDGTKKQVNQKHEPVPALVVSGVT